MPSLNFNVPSVRAVRFANTVSAANTNLLTQLSSGKRINQASDDASGLSISTKLNVDARNLGQALKTIGTAQAVANVAEVGYRTAVEIVTRISEIANQAQSGVANIADIGKEYTALLAALTATSTSTRFNGVALLDGTGGGAGTFGNATGAVLLVGAAATDTFTLKTKSVVPATLGLTTAAIGTVANAQAVSTNAATAITTLTGYLADIGADQSALNFRASLNSTLEEQTNAAVSVIADADIAKVQSEQAGVEVKLSSVYTALLKGNSALQQLRRLLDA